MHGIASVKSSTGCPYAGGDGVTFSRGEVVRLGKMACWGSACIQFVVELGDGSVAFVNASKQDKDEEKWLRKIAKQIRGAIAADRSTGWRTVWTEVSL
jgi:hypothetical protein